MILNLNSWPPNIEKKVQIFTTELVVICWSSLRKNTIFLSFKTLVRYKVVQCSHRSTINAAKKTNWPFLVPWTWRRSSIMGHLIPLRDQLTVFLHMNTEVTFMLCCAKVSVLRSSYHVYFLSKALKGAGLNTVIVFLRIEGRFRRFRRQSEKVKWL